MAKMLLILNPEVRWQRWLRRAIVIGFLTMVAMVIQGLIIGEFGAILPELLIPVFAGLLAAIEKMIRDLTAGTKSNE